MDFVRRLQRTSKNYNAISVAIDIMTMTAYFILVKINFKLSMLSHLYISWIVFLLIVLISIVSERDPRINSKVLKALQKTLDTKLHFRTTHHPQIDGQFEKTIQNLEEMLRLCIFGL